MSVRSHREADAAFTTGISVSVANQNSAIAQGLNELCMGWANAHEHEVGVARPVMQPEIAKFLLQSLAVAQHLGDVAAHVLLILKSLRQDCEGGCVDVVRRGHAADHRHLTGFSRKNANAQTGQAIRLGKSPRYEKILDLPRLVNDGFSMKFEIGFIDEHGSLLRRLRNLNQDIACNRCSSWIVGIRDRDDPGLWAEMSEQCLFRKGEIVAGTHFDNTRAFGLSEDGIHGERGRNYERFVPGI